MSTVIDDSLLAAIHARLAGALERPREAHIPWRVDGCTVGWLNQRRAQRLAGFGDVFEVRSNAIDLREHLRSEGDRTAALSRVTHTLDTERALTAWRDELYDVAPRFGTPPLFRLERAAARYFGIVTYAAHLNGLVPGHGELAMWLARRSPGKAIDPDQLDNLVGGGIRSGTSVRATLAREAWEEAGIPAELAEQAQPAGQVQLCRGHADGLQREVIFVHDLSLAEGYVPVGIDGEAVDHRRVGLREAAALIANAHGREVVTVDASLVILDCLLRRGAIRADAPAYLPLAALRTASLALAG